MLSARRGGRLRDFTLTAGAGSAASTALDGFHAALPAAAAGSFPQGTAPRAAPGPAVPAVPAVRAKGTGTAQRYGSAGGPPRAAAPPRRSQLTALRSAPPAASGAPAAETVALARPSLPGAGPAPPAYLTAAARGCGAAASLPVSALPSARPLRAIPDPAPRRLPPARRCPTVATARPRPAAYRSAGAGGAVTGRQRSGGRGRAERRLPRIGPAARAAILGLLCAGSPRGVCGRVMGGAGGAPQLPRPVLLVRRRFGIASLELVCPRLVLVVIPERCFAMYLLKEKAMLFMPSYSSPFK